MPYTGTPPGGAYHGPGIKNSATYEALMRSGMSKKRAAAISNSALAKGYKKGRHRTRKDGVRKGRQGKRAA